MECPGVVLWVAAGLAVPGTDAGLAAKTGEADHRDLEKFGIC